MRFGRHLIWWDKVLFWLSLVFYLIFVGCKTFSFNSVCLMWYVFCFCLFGWIRFAVACSYRYYCKRPILWLASSKILTPPPLPTHRPDSVYPRLWCGGRTHTLGGEGGGGSIFWKTSDTALYSTYTSTLWACVWFDLVRLKLSWSPLAFVWFDLVLVLVWFG